MAFSGSRSRCSRNGSPYSDDSERVLIIGDEDETLPLHSPAPSNASGKESNEADYETAMTRAGFGKFHYWLLLVCGWANASDAVEILCISFVLPAATCDLKLTSEDKGWLSAILFIGMLIGGYGWGSVGDTFGRKNTLVIAMAVNTLFGVSSSFCQSKIGFFVFRFLSGIGVGGSIPLVWSYFAEFQNKRVRGRMLSALATFWMVGNITVAAIAWAVIPNDIGWNPEEGFKYDSWRIFVAICALPAGIVTIALMFMPESPKYLLAKGREYEALKVFQSIFSQNTGADPNEYPIVHVRVERNVRQRMNLNEESSLVQIWNNTCLLFQKPLLYVTLMMLYINFAIQFGYYGLWLWFPELFHKLDIFYKENPEASKSVCEITNYRSNSTEIEDEFCSNPIPDAKVFTDSFLISISALPGNIWTIICMDKLGRKFFLVLSMVLSGGCAFFIYLVTSSTANLLLSCAFGFVSTMGFNALDCLGIELFPTNVRSTAMAVTLAVARLGAILGNVVFGYLIEVSCAVPILLVASLLASGGLLGIKLPNTSNVALS